MVGSARSCCCPQAKSSFVFIGAAGSSALCAVGAGITYLGQTTAVSIGANCASSAYHAVKDAICDELKATLSRTNAIALTCLAAGAVLGGATVASWILCPTNKKPDEYAAVEAT